MVVLLLPTKYCIEMADVATIADNRGRDSCDGAKKIVERRKSEIGKPWSAKSKFVLEKSFDRESSFRNFPIVLALASKIFRPVILFRFSHNSPGSLAAIFL